MLQENQNEASPPSSTTTGLATTAPSTVAERPKRSLRELLELAKQADDAFLESEVDLVELGIDIKTKVDDIVEYRDYCNSRAAIIAKRAAELAAKAGHFAARAQRLEASVEEIMVAQGLKKLPGKFWRFVTTTSSSVEPFIAKASAALKLKYRAFVRVKVSYEWDKPALRKALVDGNAQAKEVAKIVESENLNIAPLTE